MSLQVQPPRGRGLGPAVHGHENQIRTILQVADDDFSLLARAAPDRPESQGAKLVGSRASEAEPAASHRVDGTVSRPGCADEPAWREARRSFGLRRHDARHDSVCDEPVPSELKGFPVFTREYLRDSIAARVNLSEDWNRTTTNSARREPQP